MFVKVTQSGARRYSTLKGVWQHYASKGGKRHSTNLTNQCCWPASSAQDSQRLHKFNEERTKGRASVTLRYFLTNMKGLPHPTNGVEAPRLTVCWNNGISG